MTSKSKQQPVVARVLIQVYLGETMLQPNDLVSGAPELIESMEMNGQVDSAKPGVAYCVDRLGKEPINLEAAMATAVAVSATPASNDEGEIAE